MSTLPLGRRSECRVLEGLLEAIRVGESRALVLHGDAGVGKSTLLEYLLGRAEGCQVQQATGVQAEAELAFAALHQVCRPMLDRLAILPEPQRAALRTALGLSGGDPPDRFLVGLAVLGLFAEVARARPLLCVVDDAQWLDHASALILAFVARRLQAESVALVFGVRDSGTGPAPEVGELAGLDELHVGGLPEDDARALVVAAYQGPVDESVLERILAEARGNPLALRELPRGFTSAELASGFGLPRSGRLPYWVEESFRRQIAPMPHDTQQLLLVAAAEPTGDPALLRRACEWIGVDVDQTAAPAVAAGLLEIDTRIRFQHPLLRSAIYRVAPPQQRRQAHHALADATDPAKDPDRRAWHNAQAADKPDEEIAAELERCAARAQRRGGMTAAAALLSRAVELSPGPARRSARAIAAARAHHQAGEAADALRLLAIADAGRLDDLGRAQIELLRAQIAFTSHRGAAAPMLLLRAAQRLEPIDLPLARKSYLDALLAAMFAGDFADDGCLREVAESARKAARPQGALKPTDILLDGLAVRFTAGYKAAVPMLTQALSVFGEADLGADSLRWLWLAHIVAGNLWNEQTLDNARHLELARELGATETLGLALSVRVGSYVLSGDLSEAADLVTELDIIGEASGLPAAPYGELLLSAWQGDVRRAEELIEESEEEARRRGEGFGLVVAGTAAAVLGNSLGRYEDAYRSALRASRYAPVMGVESGNVLSELVEAAARIGEREVAVDAYSRLAETTQATQTSWGLGIEARCRALLATGAAAETAFQESTAQLGKTRIRGELARSHLLYGMWLRRSNRRRDAREQLRSAHGLFAHMGMQAFVERAAAELDAAGEQVRTAEPRTPSSLTPQEAQIARLVATGLSNAEIAARLFLSPRTVEWHLSKVFVKLQLTSRRQLRNRSLPGQRQLS